MTGTGGGPFKDIEITKTESELHEILGTQLTGFTSKYDSDATAESIIIQIEDNELANEICIEDIGGGHSNKKIKTDAASQGNSCSEDKYETDIFFDDSQAFEALGSGKSSLPTRTQITENLESPKMDWSTYTPSMLKKPVSTPLQSLENKDGTPRKKSKCKGLSTRLEEWAKDKTKFVTAQEKAFLEKHQVVMDQMKEKHELEISNQKKEFQMRMKFLEEEHQLKMKILAKQYNAEK